MSSYFVVVGVGVGVGVGVVGVVGVLFLTLAHHSTFIFTSILLKFHTVKLLNLL